LALALHYITGEPRSKVLAILNAKYQDVARRSIGGLLTFEFVRSLGESVTLRGLGNILPLFGTTMGSPCSGFSKHEWPHPFSNQLGGENNCNPQSP